MPYGSGYGPRRSPTKKNAWTQRSVPDSRECPSRSMFWRGIAFRGRTGLSWTLDRDKAVWFARRFSEFSVGAARLFHGNVKRQDGHAFFSGGNESEIVASEVKVLKLEKLPPPVLS